MIIYVKDLIRCMDATAGMGKGSCRAYDWFNERREQELYLVLDDWAEAEDFNALLTAELLVKNWDKGPRKTRIKVIQILRENRDCRALIYKKIRKLTDAERIELEK